MKFIKDQFALWLIVLFVGVWAIAIPDAARVGTTVVMEPPDHPQRASATTHEDTDAKYINEDSEVAVGRGIAWRQDYYDRRREYWEDRIDRRLDDEELDDESGDDKDADSKDKKDPKAAKDEKAESDLDQEEELIEKRREYWRDRLDREW